MRSDIQKVLKQLQFVARFSRAFVATIMHEIMHRMRLAIARATEEILFLEMQEFLYQLAEPVLSGPASPGAVQKVTPGGRIRIAV